MVDKVDAVVVGAGVVGLAVARRLAMAGLETVILESQDMIGTETSSRNSEVIHAGIYYPKDSAKARLCVAGKEMLYEYCQSHGVPHRRLGKLIVATNEDQVATLDKIKARAAANGVHDLELISGQEAIALEPALSCNAALISPSTGVVDSHALMLAYLGDAEEHGAMCAFFSPVQRITVESDGFIVDVGGAEPMTIGCRMLVNSAGLHAQTIAAQIDAMPRQAIPERHLAKGNYFSVSKKSPFSRLIYPVPEPGGLGVHLTLDLAGQARFGPDVEWIDRIDYAVDPARGDKFYAEVRKYWPDLPDGALQPSYSGIRPKLGAKGAPDSDFLIQGQDLHGVRGLVNLFGIESPGLTASLAIADAAYAALGLGESTGADRVLAQP